MPDHPKIDNAPGLTWRPSFHGWEARWRARTDLVLRGFKPKNQRLWIATAEAPEPSSLDIAAIQDGCARLQDEMLLWARGGLPTVGKGFDGTVGGLIACYQTDPDSSYRKLRFRTRAHYDSLCRKIAETPHEDPGQGVVPLKDVLLSEVKVRLVMRWHELWSAGGKIAMGHSMVGMFRTLCAFGATLLEDRECERLCATLGKMRFRMAKPRNERLTAAQADMIRAAAHASGRASIALAQAIQFECMLRQKDVIGEWVPISELGMSDITWGNEKWLRGVRWEEIDDDLSLRHVTSKREKEIVVDLKLAPMVMEELQRLGERPRSGPIIINECNGVPWSVSEFRRQWRKLADQCGIPKSVYNMDSRAGAISEATDAGAELEYVRQAATHSDISMTQRYSRGGEEKTAEVMRLRVAFRDKPKT